MLLYTEKSPIEKLFERIAVICTAEIAIALLGILTISPLFK